MISVNSLVSAIRELSIFRGIFLLVMSLIFCPSVCAQVPGLEQIWLQAPAQFELSEKWRLFSDASPRLSSDELRLNQLVMRGGLQYQCREQLNLALGFDSVDNYRPSSTDNKNRWINHENRLWQQVQMRWQSGICRLSTRARLEERFLLESPNQISGQSVRLRLLLQFAQSIGNSRLSALYADELFLTLNTIIDGPAAGIDRNRLFGGLSYALSRSKSKPSSLDAGYRVEYINRTDVDNEMRRQLVVQINTSY